MDKRIFKKTGEELQQYLAFKRKHFLFPPRKEKVLLKGKKNIQKISRMWCNGSTSSLGLEGVVQF